MDRSAHETAVSILEKFVAHEVVAVVMNDVVDRCILLTSLLLMTDSKPMIAKMNFASKLRLDYVRSKWTPGALIASEPLIDGHCHFQSFEDLT
jgi:hypothetical protein